VISREVSMLERGEEDALVASVAPIVRIAHTIIELAIEANATEIQIVLGTKEMEVSYWIGGHWHRRVALPAYIYPNLVTRYKVMAEVSWASRQQPFTGDFSFRHRGRYYRIEITFPPRLLDPRITMSITVGPEVEGEDEGDPI
jgi:type IV pilus assembly protein PilB